MSSIDEQRPTAHSFIWRLTAMLAVAFTAACGVAFGEMLGGEDVPSWRRAAGIWLFWFAFQAICIFVGLGWETFRSKRQLPVNAISRSWQRFRARMRRRYIRDRTREDYSRIEAGLVWPALVLGALLLLLIPTEIAMTAVAGSAMLYLSWCFYPLFQAAPQHPVRTVLIAAVLSLDMGYFTL